MVERPGALGLEFEITDLVTADQALHELAWLLQRMDMIDAETKAKIDAIKTEAIKTAMVTIEEHELSLVERANKLAEVLSEWTTANIVQHFAGKKRSVDLAHGTLGLRQKPLVAQFADEENAGSVLSKIDEKIGYQVKVNAILDQKSGIGTAKARDLIDINVAPACKAMKDAREAKRLTAEDLTGLGISLRAAYDDPVVTPTKNIVIA